MGKTKNLSNPFSTGGGGVHFESAVQACFVTLMLTGGYAPCVAPWPVVEVKLQGRVEGFETDDLIVYIQNPISHERRCLLAQVKHSVSFTAKSPVLAEVLAAAWADFNNSVLFAKGSDAIALVTGPLSAVDQASIRWLLQQARTTQDAAEFYRNVETANFSPPKAEEKLAVIELHLQNANGGVKLSKEQIHEFLRHYHVVGFDLDNDAGISLALLHSHMSQVESSLPQWAWGRIVDVVQMTNHAAGTLTVAGLPEDLRNAFERRPGVTIPKELQVSEGLKVQDWSSHPDATPLAMAVLIGSWDEKSESDVAEVAKLFGLEYSAWLSKARELLHSTDSPLAIHDGRWTVNERARLFEVLSSRLLDQDLEAFRDAAVRILSERDPAFDLPPDERYAASIYGKAFKYSASLRKGVAEGLALLGTRPQVLANCSTGKGEVSALIAVRSILDGADGVLWGSLNPVLPVLAEASSSEFLAAVEAALGQTPCPFDQLFEEESTGVTGRNYMTGLLWALEGLAWDPAYLVRVIIALGELANHDPGGNWTNRPSNSMATILLPWLPQTLAPVDKRLVAVRAVLTDQPVTGWNLVLQLLPGHHTISTGAHKPQWRKTIPDDWEKGVTHGEYWEQVKAYADLALSAAGSHPHRLAQLAARLSNLPKHAFSAYLERLAQDDVRDMPESQRREIWTALTRLARKHRRFPDAEWALKSDRVALVESTAKLLAPSSPFERYRYLFDENESDLFAERGNWETQRIALEVTREQAVAEMHATGDLSGLLSFAEAVRFPRQVGLALGASGSDALDDVLLLELLKDQNNKRRFFVDGYIWRRFQALGWEWADRLLGRDWRPLEKARFLTELPFDEPAWSRAEALLDDEAMLYWKEVQVSPYQTQGDLTVAIEKLIAAHRPHAAIECLAAQRLNKQAPLADQVIRALLDAMSSTEARAQMDTYNIQALITYLQELEGVNEDELFKVEWAYLPLLGPHDDAKPVLLESKLATDPNFFSEVIGVLYRSKAEAAPPEEASPEKKAIASNAWRLLNEWRRPPGLKSNGAFSPDDFRKWLSDVKSLCQASGRLEVAMIQVGEVLIHTPPDPSGLWIDRAVAEALNARDAEQLRDGFRTGVYNSRGVHVVDPTGAPERALAEEYRSKAEAVEDVGYSRFAISLRMLADSYERDAQRIVDSRKGGDRQAG